MEASINNPKNLLNSPQQNLPDDGDNKKQALTNLGIFIAIFVILLMGVKFATWSASKWSGEGGEESEVMVEGTLKEPLLTITADNEPVQITANAMEALAGKGEVVFSISSQADDVVREILLHNPHKDSWVQVYDGYRSVTAEPVEVYRVTLSPITFDKVRVRTINNLKDFDKEVNVQGDSSLNIVLEL